MPNFDELFRGSMGNPVFYKGIPLLRMDKFPVKNGDILIASIEKTNDSDRQGFVIDITGYCEMNGEICKKGKRVRMAFWEDTMPKQVELKVFTKQDFVVIENIWEEETSYLAYGTEKHSKFTNYRVNGAAMIVEEIENGRRYRCNDGAPDEDFDDIIFTVRRLN